MKSIRIAAAALTVAIAAPPSIALANDKPVELAPAQLAKIQTHSYPVSSSVAMAAAVAALQAQGYLDIEANKDAGTVSGHTDAKSKLMFNIFWGLGKKKLTQTAQFLVEELVPGRTTVTLNLFVNESKTRSIVFGNRMTDAMLVKVGQPYSTMMTQVDMEVRKRVAAIKAAEAQEAATAAAASAPAPIPTPTGITVTDG